MIEERMHTFSIIAILRGLHNLSASIWIVSSFCVVNIFVQFSLTTLELIRYTYIFCVRLFMVAKCSV